MKRWKIFWVAVCITAYVMCLASRVLYKNGTQGELRSVLVPINTITKGTTMLLPNSSKMEGIEAYTMDVEDELPEEKLVEIIADPFTDSFPMYDGVAQYPKPFKSYIEQTAFLQENCKYFPQSGLTDASYYGDAIFFDLVLHPEKVKEYGRILTKTSVEAWRRVPWIYANPESCYDSVSTYKAGNADERGNTRYVSQIYLKDETKVMDRRLNVGVDKQKLRMTAYCTQSFDVCVQVYWDYEGLTGKVQIMKVHYMDLSSVNKEREIERVSHPQLNLQRKLYDVFFVSYAKAKGIDIQAMSPLPKARPNLNISVLENREDTVGGGKMFLDLVLHPEKVEQYGAILTETSVEAWKKFQWIYANPQNYYNQVYSSAFSDTGDYVTYLSRVTVSPDYLDNETLQTTLDCTLAEGVTEELWDYIWKEVYTDKYNVAIYVYWEFEKRTGLIQIIRIDYHCLSV